MTQILKKNNLPFTSLHFYENYVISYVKEGEVLTKTQLQELIDICGDFYKDKEYVYISERINIYNVDPIIYMKLYNVKNLNGIAIASKQAEALSMANFEKNFSSVPFEVFTEVKEAKAWALEIVKSRNSRD